MLIDLTRMAVTHLLAISYLASSVKALTVSRKLRTVHKGAHMRTVESKKRATIRCSSESLYVQSGSSLLNVDRDNGRRDGGSVNCLCPSSYTYGFEPGIRPQPIPFKSFPINYYLSRRIK